MRGHEPLRNSKVADAIEAAQQQSSRLLLNVVIQAAPEEGMKARSGEHDDLMLAVAVAVWGGVAMSAFPPTTDIGRATLDVRT